MTDEKQTPDALTKTSDDEITLTEKDLNEVSGGHQPGQDIKLDYKE
jgi:bacteriocin-like protein